MKSSLKILIAKGDTKAAIEALMVLTNNTVLSIEVVQQSSLFEQYSKDVVNGVLSSDAQRIELARITSSLLQIIEKLPVGTSLSSKNGVESFPADRSDMHPNSQNGAKPFFISRKKWDSEKIKMEFLTPDFNIEFDGYKGSIETLALSSDRQYLASGTDDGWITSWTLDGKILNRIKLKHRVDLLEFSSDGKYLICGHEDENKICFLDFKNSAKVLEIKQKFDRHAGVSVSPDNKFLLISYNDKIKILDFDNGSEIKRTKVKGGVAFAMFSPDGRYVLAVGEKVYLFDFSTFQQVRKFKTKVMNPSSITSACFSSDTRQLVFGDSDGKVLLWDIEGNELLNRFYGFKDVIESICFSPDRNSILAYTESPDRVILFDVETGEKLYKLVSRKSIICIGFR